MTWWLAPALSGLVAAAGCSIQYINSNSPFTWKRTRLLAILRCAIDGAAGVAAFLIAKKLFNIHGMSWWWATGLAAPAILRSYITTWQSAGGDEIDIGPSLIYDKLTNAIEDVISNREGRAVSNWLKTTVAPALRNLTTDEVIARFDPVLRRRPFSQDKLTRAVPSLKRIAANDPTRIKFYNQIVMLGGRGILNDLVAEATQQSRQSQPQL
jgi:hypothetical protein